MRNSVKEMTQGAMIVALTGVILILNRQSGGILESSFYWLLSFPILIYSVRSELKMTLMVFFSCLFVSFLFSTPQTIFYLFSALTTGAVYGWGVKQKWSNSKLLTWTFITTFISCFVTMFALASAFGYNIVEGRNELLEMIQPFIQFLPVSAQVFVKTIDILTTVLIVALQSLCTHLVAVLLFRKLKIECNPIRTAYEWQPVKWTAWLSIIMQMIYFIMPMLSLSEQIQEMILFGYMACMCAYFIYGLIICRFIARRKRWIKILYIPIFWNLLAYLGIIDTLMDGKVKREGRLWTV